MSPAASRVVAAVTIFCLWASTPPALLPGAEWLVLPGWMAFYALATGSRRPLLLCWAIGALHVLLFSASLRHVVILGWLAMGPVGGLYYLLAAAGTRWMGKRLAGAWAFAISLAAVEWLRAHVPEIPYPHGQPIHALHGWPALLGSVQWGGEVLGNFLVGALAGAAVDLYRSWRIADPPWRRARASIACAAGAGLLVTLVPAPRRAVVRPVVAEVVALEPGFEPMFQLRPDYLQLVEERLLEPTRRIAGRGVERAPDLVLWPETSHPGGVVLNGRPRPVSGGLPRPGLSPRTQLLAGALVQRGEKLTPAAVLYDSEGRYLDHHEKLVPVPGGERIPFLDLLPRFLADAIREGIRASMGSAPDFAAGVFRPPLQTNAGPVGAMMCFDNAFPGISARHVEAGAALLVVLSNESWYVGGAERDQLAAATVLRALETGTPIVRCTVDGLSLAVGPDGRVLASLEDRPARQDPGTRILPVRLPLGPGRLPPMAWLHAVLGPLLGGILGIAFAHRLLSWARLLRVRRSSGVPAPGEAPRHPPLQGGS